MGRPKKYTTEEERKEAKRLLMKKRYNEKKLEILEQCKQHYQEHKGEIRDRQTKYYQLHKEGILEKQAKFNQAHKEEVRERKARYYNTKEGRATHLINNYKRNDKKYYRGECDLTVPWFVRNIFTKCIYCGESDWKKLGCDRIDNSLPHTIENVAPSCWDCNYNRRTKSFEQFYWEMKHKNEA